jgi:poly-gamma-glutamate synthesis protein (capsule biosynthesis protein)
MLAADIRFTNCERQYSARPVAADTKISDHGCQPPGMAKIFSDCGFQAVSIANNHMFDHGAEGLFDTRDVMASLGIAVTGAGRDLDEAREPAIVERKGVKVGFLGYCAHIPVRGEAGKNKPGVAPLRVKTYYEPRGPHAPARVLTEPSEQDLRMITDDIRALRPKVDAVMIAFHWGVTWVPRVIADYQVTVAHACIDAGADLIMGHHPHIPKGIEIYKGKAIYYCLGNFCKTKPGGPNAAWKELPWIHGALRNHTELDPDYPVLPHGVDSKRAILAKAIVGKGGVKQFSFVPMWLDTLYRPRPLKRGDPEFDDMLRYMDWCSDGFNHKFTAADGEVIVTAA